MPPRPYADDQDHDDLRDALHRDCAALERCLLVLARFSSSHQHHRRTLNDAGHDHIETAAERRHRHLLAEVRRAAYPDPKWTSSDPASLAAPACISATTRVNTGLYPVLALVEDLIDPQAVAVARALALDRSTALRHLQTLERRGLVYRDAGWLWPRHPRFLLTVDGFNAMVELRRSRIRRVEACVHTWPAADRQASVRSLTCLARALHLDISPVELPWPLTDEDARDRWDEAALRERGLRRRVFPRQLRGLVGMDADEQ